MMAKAKNSALNQAGIAKEDEFYTKLTDIEKELRHYREHFKGKVIFCNCDDPETSNFCKYFQLNFYQLGIKKLISTHFEASKPSYKLEIISTENDINGQMGLPQFVKTPLQQNGDFRSPECIEILKEADIVVTNPPYNKSTEFVEHALKLIPEGNKVVMFLKIQFLETTKRYEQIFKINPPKKIYVAVKRFACKKDGDFTKDLGSALCYCWFVWEKGFKGEPIIRWFN